MARSHRLFELMQALRRHRRTVSGASLAQELGVSLRTIRRDVATLQGMGADIEGEPGLGYILKPGFLLPPLSFTEEEIQALMIGAQWVSRQTDDKFAFAVKNALAKISAVLPVEMRPTLEDETFYISRPFSVSSTIDLSEIRRALRDQCKLSITLSIEHAPKDPQTIWPIMLGFIESRRHLAAWCEGDSKYRIIDMDDIAEAQVLTERYTRNRRQMIKEWRALEILPCNVRGETC
ncbi:MULTISPECIES: helix-turn-helix transcriptional regulator [Pseudomonas syringae group]|uniref:helix-turn-helix transcriptional regulator n=1 Tax=Pseudomonas syringae group TaxID=136849 RepID=UPI0005B6D173|nr:YafY family protein [Pseudomonas viridiflava]MBD8570516.1 YafY family transcriptional regulator [Pseudomonas syringae]KIQ34328.1 transcriptional regulator [Pseudomonas viridiflava]MEE4079022.1 YafY family protein [Pseudomonas viridiflava]MEE4101651.1 YafY family protein [Pseudomonas viridiflava]MEE4228599.1 YafY family protein [Pseudomonas viridiflava]